MKSRFTIYFLLRYGSTLLLATGILTMVGYISYHSLDQMVTAIASGAKPNKRLVMLKEIQYNLADAELNARTYSLTGEYETINLFYENVSQSQEKLNTLYTLSNQQPLQRLRIESIRTLVDKRVALMKNLIELRSDTGQSTAQLLDIKANIIKLSQNNHNATDVKNTTGQEAKTSDEGKKKNFFKRVFGRKNKDENENANVANKENTSEKEVDPGLTTNREFTSLASRIDGIARAQKERKEEMIRRELEIISQDKDMSQRIRSLISRIERDEQKVALVMAEEASNNARFTTMSIVVLTVITALILMISAFTVYRYVKANQRYRKVLNDSRHRAEQLARLRLEFLSNMSHEIRTPLNAIVGFSEQLEKLRLTPEQEKTVKIIRNSSDHLSVLINDVLDHAKMQSGMFNFEDITFKPREVIQQSVDFFSYEALRKGIDLTLTYTNSIPEYVGGDPLRLRQILLNLISNALKFTSQGFVSLGITWHAGENEEEGVLELNVADSGIGIAPEKQKIIFEEYAQADASTSRKYGGTGLGLTITKKLIEMQGGTVELQSELNTGTCFTVKIPYRIITKIEKTAENIQFTPASVAQLKNMRILIADDENYNRLLMQQIFKKWNVIPELAIDGLDALDKLGHNTYDLILMDVRMPYLDGIEATRKIRSGFSSANKNIPIIAVTAGASGEDRTECLAAGMNDFITKPFRENQLIKVLARVMMLETTGTSANAFDENGHAVAIDLTELQQLTGNDDEFLKKMIAGFIESSSVTVDEMGEFLRKEDHDGIAMVSHRLAAPARHMGFTNMAIKLKEIERIAREKGDMRELSQLIREIKQEAINVNKRLRNKLGELT